MNCSSVPIDARTAEVFRESHLEEHRREAARAETVLYEPYSGHYAGPIAWVDESLRVSEPSHFHFAVQPGQHG